MDLYTFLKRLPKVSLHVHLAGSVQSPRCRIRQQERGGAARVSRARGPLRLPGYLPVPQDIRPRHSVSTGARGLSADHLNETLQQAAEHGVRHREMFWNPTIHMAWPACPTRRPWTGSSTASAMPAPTSGSSAS